MASITLNKPKKKEKYTLKELKSLGHDLLSSRTHINNLPLLLTFVSPTSPSRYLVEALLSLQSFFTPILTQLPPSTSSKRSPIPNQEEDPELIYLTWLRSKFDEFLRLLIDVLVSDNADEAVREVVLDTLMQFVKLGNGGSFHSAIYHRLLHSIVHSKEHSNILSQLLASKYFKYIDVSFFTYISLEKLVKILETKDNSDNKVMAENGEDVNRSKESMELSIHKIHNILSSIPPLEEKSEMWGGSGSPVKEDGDHEGLSKQLGIEKLDSKAMSSASIAKKMKLKFTKAWISFLRLPLPLDVYKEVLVNLHQAVIPCLSTPITLCDFLTRSYDIGGVVSVMALSSLFVLMTEHGLEYPNFYEKLYALLLPSIFMAKHRAKFFQLLDACLKSPLLPAYLAAAFAKKLSRLSLSVPPSGALIIIALIHNLLRRHPSINCLVHREVGEETTNNDSETEGTTNNDADDNRAGKDTQARKVGVDHFNFEDSNPMKSNAMRSSLWEVESLRHHYCPPVSRFVLSLENDLTVRAKTTEVNVQDFSSGSYATIFGDEIRRRVKQVPLAFYKATPTSLFSEADFGGWTFENTNVDGEKNTSTSNVSEENGQISAKRQRLECA